MRTYNRQKYESTLAVHATSTRIWKYFSVLETYPHFVAIERGEQT